MFRVRGCNGLSRRPVIAGVVLSMIYLSMSHFCEAHVFHVDHTGMELTQILQSAKGTADANNGQSFFR